MPVQSDLDMYLHMTYAVLYFAVSVSRQTIISENETFTFLKFY